EDQGMLIAERGEAPGSREDRFLLQHIRKRRRRSRSLPHTAEIDLLIHAADPAELGGVEARLLVVHQRLHGRRGAEVAELGAVPRRDVVDVVRRPQCARARHVLGHDNRIAGDVAAIMPGEDSEIEVGGAAGRIADIDADGLALEAGRCLRQGGRAHRERYGSKQQFPHHSHPVTAAVLDRGAPLLTLYGRSARRRRRCLAAALDPIAKPLAVCSANCYRRCINSSGGQRPMRLPRRKFLRLAAGASALPMLSRVAGAQTYPTKPITIVVPFAAGGPTDTLARILADRMRVSLGQTVVIENVVGAAGTMGVNRVVRAAPEGYTVSIGHLGTHVVNGAIYPLQYDLLRDFEPVGLIADHPSIVVSKNAVPAKDLKELIAWAK